ncbi:MAG: DUF2197 domain-containing protein [Chitinophagales bacterium]
MIEVRCALCGQKTQVGEEDKDYKKLTDPGKKVTYICNMCNNRVRFESDDKQKPKKPI